MRFKAFVPAAIGLFCVGMTGVIAPAFAEVTVLDKDDWKLGIGGFVEMDLFHDTTRSLVETVGSSAIARPGSFDGDNGRTQFSLRNSRFFFNVLPPAQGGWKTRGYLEFDLLGYDPAPPAVSEAGYFTNPTLRVRHAFLSAEQDGWQILAGQTWTLFGWEPEYVLATFSVNPVTGTLYQRAPRVSLIKALDLTETNQLKAGVALVRPTQRDSEIPNVDVGVRWAFSGRKGGFTGPNSDIKAQPMSIGLSGTFREFSMPVPGGTDSQTTDEPASALAIDAFIPILASSDGKDFGNTLSLAGEFTHGKGYGDEFPSWNGGLPQLLNGNASKTNANIDPSFPNVDAGLGGRSASGGFELVDLQSWNLELQYHLPDGWTSFVTAGYGQLYSDNMGDFAAAATAKSDRSQVYFVNVGHDFSTQIRVGVELDHFTTHYLDDTTSQDNRVMVASFFRF